MTEILANVVPITYGAERLDFGRVKGAIIRGHLDWVRDHGSRSEVIALFEQIPDFLRYQISTLAPAAWYPFRTLIAVDRLIVDHFGNGESHRDWYDFGDAEYVESSDRSGCLLRRGYGAHSALDCASTGGFYRECIRLHGAEPVVRESACRCRADSFCAFDLSWRF
jgi:hypothetical protein